MTAPPETFDELVGELQHRLPSLSPAHRRLAQRIMADPEAVAFMTISELAADAGVNEATVVRFAGSLGLKGYPGVAHLCRLRLREQAQLLHRYDTMESDGEELLQRATMADQANIARTVSRIEPATWDAAVAALSEAPRVHVMGLRKCHAPAYLLGYLLRMVREDVETVTVGAGTLADDLRRVRAGDCFVALAIHRYSTETVRAAGWAQRRGAHGIALTDNPGSPLALTADEVFYVDVSGPSVLRSVTAFTSLTQALAGGVAQALGHQARETLLDEEALLRDFHAYTDEAGG
ncbi:MAG: SIS domain-containing protein [Streptosporangiales bacterium]|nr:SIS domain-containing protein [Streptosporangiales bacterium]